MKRNIAIIGTGYVGLATGICLAYLGHRVFCVDKDKSKVQKLKKGIIPIYEPGLKDFLEKNKNNIVFSSNLKEALKESEVVFICVGTPSKKDGSIDMEYFHKAIKEISANMQKYKVIVNKSTVPVGTGEWTRREIKKHYNGDFSIVSNPEFLREGSALKDFLESDRIVIGVEDDKAKKIMLDIYSSIDAPKLITNIKSAELIKYAANAFLATKISFINEIANICEKTGGDIIEIAKGVGMDKRIGPKFFKAGIGYGGSCFPKDIDGLLSISDSHQHNFNLLRAVSEVNISQQKKFVKKIKKLLSKTKGNIVCVWGLAFKPNTDDVRKSPAIEVIKSLQRAGCRIQAYDPIAVEKAKKELSMKNIKFCKSALEAVKNADVLALITEWPEFSEVNMEKVKKLMRHPYILDGRNQLEIEKIKKLGFNYEGIGRK